MVKMFSNKIFIKYHKFHHLKILADVIPNTEDVMHTSAEKGGLGYFIKKMICEKVAYLSKGTQSNQPYYTKLLND